MNTKTITQSNTVKLSFYMMYEHNYHGVDISGKSFLVTGGAGFVGSHIVEYLLKYGAGKVRVLDNLLTGRLTNIEQYLDHPNFEFVEGDIRDIDVCQYAASDIDYITHQAALGSVPRSIKDPATTNSINVDGFLNMLIAARDQKVRRFIYASSSSVYGDNKDLPKREEKVGLPLSPYAVSKRADEMYAQVFAKTYSMQIIGMRYFNIFGPRQDPSGPYAAVIPIFIEKILAGVPVYIDGDGEQSRDFTFVENAVQANIRALLCPMPDVKDQIYNIAYGQNFSLNFMLKEILLLLEKNTTPNYRAERLGDIKHSLADISKARTFLKYQPLFDFKSGLAQTIAHFEKLIY